MNKDTIDQFDEQAIEKSKFFNKRTLIIGTLIGILVPVAFFLSLDYFDKNPPATRSYQYVLAEHLKVNKLNNPTAKTKQSKQSKPAKQTKSANKALVTETTDIKNTHKNTAKMSAVEDKINTAYQNHQANDHKHNQKSSYQISQKSNQKHNQESNQKCNQENNQAQIADLYKNPQTYFNNLLKAQTKHTDEIILKLDESQADTKRTIGQLKHSIGVLIAKISPLFNQQATKIVKTKPEPRAKVNPKPKPLKQTNTTVFELVDISLWDDRPQATIRYQGKTSIVDVKSIRLGWKIIKIDFDKEQITIANAKNGQQITLEKIR